MFRYRPKGVLRKVLAITRMRQKWFRKTINNALKMRQTCLVLLGKEERSKMRQTVSKLRQKCVKTALNTFGGETPIGLDDTDFFV